MYRDELAAGRNPIKVRADIKAAQKTAAVFGQCAEALISAKSSEWRSVKHHAQWRGTLCKYAAHLWSTPVTQIDTEAVLSVLKPIWSTKPESASRVRGRIEAVIDWARAKGEIPRNEANPARWRGHLDKLLPARSKLSRGHFAAMPYEEVPAFVAKLREQNSTAALALEFALLTAARTGEVIGSQWPEIDFHAKVWTIPAGRTKAGRTHRVPLSQRALAILAPLDIGATCDFIFPGRGSKRPLSNMALEMLLRRMAVKHATVHGFRSSFRDWAGNETNFAREVAEAALGHVVGGDVERAYRRSDALEKRRKLMEAWAGYCQHKAMGEVISIHRPVRRIAG